MTMMMVGGTIALCRFNSLRHPVEAVCKLDDTCTHCCPFQIDSQAP